MKNRIAITLALTALVVGVLASASIGQAASKAGSAQLPQGGSWQDVAPLPQTLFGPATTTDGTYIYAFGGYHFPENIGSTLTTVYRYDPTANSWSSLADMPQPSLIATAVYYPPTNKVYLFGGATRTPDPVVVYDTTLIYDIATNSWSTGPTMPGFRYQAYNPDGKLHKGVLEAFDLSRKDVEDMIMAARIAAGWVTQEALDKMRADQEAAAAAAEAAKAEQAAAPVAATARV